MLHQYTIFLALLFGFPTEGSRCRLPWTGSWLENEIELNITHNSIGNLGSCVQKSRDLYLLASDTSKGPCYRCLITFPVHENVLHYKTTQCIFEADMSLERCSMLMSADTTMHTLFRKDAAPVTCPIDAPLNFTYQSNFGICNSRTSYLHRCAQYDRLALHYQACPEIPNREAMVWQMECIGSWQSFGQSYFAARVGYTAGEHYRCFILDKTGSTGRVGESADAGCQELTHISTAATTIHFRQDTPIFAACDFPALARPQWESMLVGTTHRFQNGHWISSVNGRNESVWTCIQKFVNDVDPGKYTYRTHVTNGCQVGYQCVRMHLRKPHLLHVEYGEVSARVFEDCTEFPVHTRDTLLMYGANEACPIGGKHYSSGCAQSVLQVGCESKYEMRLLRDCQFGQADEFTCVSHYKHEDNDFIILRDNLSRQLFCLTYVTSRINLLRVYDRVSCDAISVNNAIPINSINFTSTDSCAPSLLTGFLYSTRSTASIDALTVFSMMLYNFL